MISNVRVLVFSYLSVYYIYVFLFFTMRTHPKFMRHLQILWKVRATTKRSNIIYPDLGLSNRIICCTKIGKILFPHNPLQFFLVSAFFPANCLNTATCVPDLFRWFLLTKTRHKINTFPEHIPENWNTEKASFDNQVNSLAKPFSHTRHTIQALLRSIIVIITTWYKAFRSMKRAVSASEMMFIATQTERGRHLYIP